jgi:predicted dinucleotide-utilizing enzyme
MGAKALFIDVLYAARLTLQSVGLITQTVVKRRKAKSTFKKTLILQGITPKIADELAKEYPNPITQIFALLRNNT